MSARIKRMLALGTTAALILLASPTIALAAPLPAADPTTTVSASPTTAASTTAQTSSSASSSASTGTETASASTSTSATAEPTSATPTAHSASSTATSSASASTTASSTSSRSASTQSRSVVKAAAVSAAQRAAVSKAVTFLSKNLPTTDDGVGTMISVALGLAASGKCSGSTALNSLMATFKKQAASIAEDSPGAAAKLAIAVAATGGDPTSFGGVNLIQAITDGTNATTGQVGSWGSAFTQSLAIIAYSRAGKTVPDNIVTSLLTYQDSSGAFGYDWGGFTADPDSTGLAIQALALIGGHETSVAKALAWASAHKTSAGYWAAYSPVDSAGLLGSAVLYTGGNVAKTTSWMLTQQLSDGGFPAELNGKTSNALATAEALFLLAQSPLATVSFQTSTCPTSSASATATSSSSSDADADTLASTGASEATIPMGVAGIVLVALGGVLLITGRQVANK